MLRSLLWQRVSGLKSRPIAALLHRHVAKQGQAVEELNKVQAEVEKALVVPENDLSVQEAAEKIIPQDPMELIACGPCSPQVTKTTLAFDNPQQAFESKSTFELARAYVVLKMCTWKWLVENSESLLRLGNSVAPPITNWLVKHSFFAHFCAGEDMEGLRPTVSKLKQAGIGSIMDYAAEADVAPEQNTSALDGNEPARKYDYISEEECDKNLENFKECIKAVHNVTPAGVAAVKMTALGLPAILERMSVAIETTKKLFRDLDTNKNGFLSFQSFSSGLKKLYPGLSESHMQDLYRAIDSDQDEIIDYVEWTNVLRTEEIWQLIRNGENTLELPALGKNMPDEEEIRLIRNMQRRIDELAAFASEYNVRIMIDAEQTYFQPAIDSIVLTMQSKYNIDKPLIFNTYQCYLKDALQRVSEDLIRAQRGGYRFAAKLVRGAYMHAERLRAQEHGYPDPIHDTIEHTHEAYHRAIDLILQQHGAHLLIASHNKESIEYAVEQMDRLGLNPEHQGSDTSVCFAQLLGMSDHLTYTLGKHGYKAYKYVPYGPVQEVLPYLVRRAKENGDFLSGAKFELDLLKKEVKRRLQKS